MSRIASKGKGKPSRTGAPFAALEKAVPALFQHLDERVFACHVGDAAAVCRAYLEGAIRWDDWITGLEAALFQARAVMVDRDAAVALVDAAQAVAAYAGAAVQRAGRVTPSGTGFALSVSNTNSKPKANPKVPARYPKAKSNPKAKSTGSTS